MSARSIIAIEANEVPFKVFDYFIRRRPNSALAGLMDRSSQYCTHTEDRARFIMPWTTWPSFHRGVNDEAHGIFKFGQWDLETDKRYPPIWAQLARNGIRAGVFSSMQSSPLPPDRDAYAFYFPDMFSNDSATVPPDLESLQEFNLAMTRESGRNVSRRIDLKRGARLFLDSRKLGIRARTYADIATQLASEVVNPSRKTRRRAYQPLIMLDAFCRQLELSRPQFSTFFTNHVAAAMHRYWAAVFPEDYERFELDRAWVDRYSGEIEFAMSKLDQIVARLVRFVDTNSDYMLVVSTSMGQAAIPASHVRQFLTITNVPAFMAAFGLKAGEYEERPAMVPDFSFSVNPGRAVQLESELHDFTIDGKPAEFHRNDSFFDVAVYDERPGLKHAVLRGQAVGLEAIGLGYMVHEDEVACTAQHVPQGSLMVYSPHSSARVSQSRADISALDFAPSVLKHFGIEAPRYMRSAALFAAC